MEAEDIDTKHLISLVEARPELWDKFLDRYKDRIITKNSWEEVCTELYPNFENLDTYRKNAFVKEVVKKWSNLRDSLLRYKKKIKQKNSTSGSKATKIKKYLYFDQLQFLNKVYNERETVDSMDQKKQENEGETSTEGNAEDSADVLEVSIPHHTKSTSTPKARKHKKPDKGELKILKALEGEKLSSKMAFLQSLMPHLQKFDDEEFLQFQMGVLNVIRYITEIKKAMHPHQQFPTYPQRQFVNPSTVTQCQSQQLFPSPNQPPFYHEQYGQTSTCTQVPIPNQSQPSSIGNKQTPLLQELSSSKPLSCYFSSFSPESEENSLSLTSPASSIADST